MDPGKVWGDETEPKGGGIWQGQKIVPTELFSRVLRKPDLPFRLMVVKSAASTFLQLPRFFSRPFSPETQRAQLAKLDSCSVLFAGNHLGMSEKRKTFAVCTEFCLLIMTCKKLRTIGHHYPWSQDHKRYSTFLKTKLSLVYRRIHGHVFQ